MKPSERITKVYREEKLKILEELSGKEPFFLSNTGIAKLEAAVETLSTIAEILDEFSDRLDKLEK